MMGTELITCQCMYSVINLLYSTFRSDPKDTDGLSCNTEKDRKTRLHERSAGRNIKYSRLHMYSNSSSLTGRIVIILKVIAGYMQVKFKTVVRHVMQNTISMQKHAIWNSYFPGIFLKIRCSELNLMTIL